jgi:uncharacterized radical SAM protein YgiQ
MGSIRGTASITKVDESLPAGVVIPSFGEVSSDKGKYAEAFRLLSGEQNPYCARTVLQRHGDRLLVCNPPAMPLTESEMDAIYALPFTKAPHPSYREPIPAYEQIKTSLTTHRGCFGGCAFCAITHHQGRFIQSRSVMSVQREVRGLTELKWFRGSISDVGGPTANMYGLRCGDSSARAVCRRESCLFPRPCRNLVMNGKPAADLLRKVRAISGVKHVAVASGVRYDLLAHQPDYLKELLSHHVGGLLKVAPEHAVDRVTALMRKPGRRDFEAFLELFRRESARLGKRQHVVPYLISGHPGTTLADMVELALLLKRAGLRVEQVQDFTPTPGTLSTCMYHTGIDPLTGESVHVPRSDREKRLQKSLLLGHISTERANIMQALRQCGREEVAGELLGVAAGKGKGSVRKGSGGR